MPATAFLAPALPALRLASSLALAALLAACAAPWSGPAAPASSSPPVAQAPAAEPPARPGRAAPPVDGTPRVEPVRPGGANRPYQVGGRTIVPMTEDLPFSEKGSASWYGKRFQGRPTASGEIYDMNALTAAHRTLPLPSYVRVRNLENGRELIVRVNDRGPMTDKHVIDLSYAAAARLGALKGSTQVVVERLTNADIRTGAWREPRHPAPQPVQVAQPAPARKPGPPAAAAATIAQVEIDDAGDAQIPPTPGNLPIAELPAPDRLAPGVLALAPGEQPVIAAADGRIWLQFGPFRDRETAEVQRTQLREELGELLPGLDHETQGKSNRLKAGPYASREAAQAAARRVALRGLKPMMLVQR